jgi:hypothetical protein
VLTPVPHALVVLTPVPHALVVLTPVPHALVVLSPVPHQRQPPNTATSLTLLQMLLLFRGSDLAVLGVVDWELATLGNAWADVAYCCLPYHLPSLSSAVLPLQSPLPAGIPSEQQYLAWYCELRGLEPPSKQVLTKGWGEGNVWGCVVLGYGEQCQRLCNCISLTSVWQDALKFYCLFSIVFSASCVHGQDWAFYLALALFRVIAILAGVAARARQGNASSANAAQVGDR